MRVVIMRGSDDSPGALRAQAFEVPDFVDASVSNVLQYINRHVDGSVAYYLSCRRGLCACCVVRIGGRIEKACVVPARDGMVIEPVRGSLLIKDTVVHLGVPPEHAFDPGDSLLCALDADGDRMHTPRGDESCD